MSFDHLRPPGSGPTKIDLYLILSENLLTHAQYFALSTLSLSEKASLLLVSHKASPVLIFVGGGGGGGGGGGEE